ncbi:hypothetical protein Tco_0222654 [Tanacetum coccineum]
MDSRPLHNGHEFTWQAVAVVNAIVGPLGSSKPRHHFRILDFSYPKRPGHLLLYNKFGAHRGPYIGIIYSQKTVSAHGLNKPHCELLARNCNPKIRGQDAHQGESKGFYEELTRFCGTFMAKIRRESEKNSEGGLRQKVPGKKEIRKASNTQVSGHCHARYRIHQRAERGGNDTIQGRNDRGFQTCDYRCADRDSSVMRKKGEGSESRHPRIRERHSDGTLEVKDGKGNALGQCCMCPYVQILLKGAQGVWSMSSSESTRRYKDLKRAFLEFFICNKRKYAKSGPPPHVEIQNIKQRDGDKRHRGVHGHDSSWKRTMKGEPLN